MIERVKPSMVVRDDGSEPARPYSGMADQSRAACYVAGRAYAEPRASAGCAMNR